MGDQELAFINNLLSGAIGAVLGAVASIVALLVTNAYTRGQNVEALAAQKAQFDIQIEGDRGLAREARELEAVAELLTFLQEFDRSPLDMGHVPRITALCNLLWLNVPGAVADGWLLRDVGHVEQSSAHRHPLAAAIVTRASALQLTQVFPNTATFADGRPGDGPSVLGIVTTDSVADFRSAVGRVAREMLRWSRLGDDEKISLFATLVTDATRFSTETLTLANVLLGGDEDRPVIDWLSEQPELSELVSYAEELGNPVDSYLCEAAQWIFEEEVNMESFPRAPKSRREVRLRRLDNGHDAVSYFAPSFIDVDVFVGESLDDSHAPVVEVRDESAEVPDWITDEFTRARRADE